MHVHMYVCMYVCMYGGSILFFARHERRHVMASPHEMQLAEIRVAEN